MQKDRQPGHLQGHSLQGPDCTTHNPQQGSLYIYILITPCEMQNQMTPGTSLRKRLTCHHRLQAGQLLWLELPKEAAHHLQAPSAASATILSLLGTCKRNPGDADKA